MIAIHSTKKLYAKLPLDVEGCVAAKPVEINSITSAREGNPLSGWHANLIVLQR